MCKRLFFLISFVLVLSFGTNALAEDLSIPYWAGGERAAWAVWNFNDDGLSNWDGGSGLGQPDLYDGPDPNFEATHVAQVQQDYTWYDQYQGRQGVWVTTGSWAGDLLGNMANYASDLDCTKKKFRFQVTYYPIVGEGLVDPQIGPNGWVLTGSEGDWDYWNDHIVDLPGGWKHTTMEVTIDPWEYDEEWWELMGANHAIDQVIIDTVCYSGDEPPPGTGIRPRLAGAFNPRPADDADRVDPDNLLLIWDPDPRSAQETVYFSDDFNDVNDRELAALKSIQDANYYPADGNYLGDVCDLILGETYYWAIDEVNVTTDFDGPGPVWSFTIKTAAAGAPSPDVNEIAGPCPTLTWDPGYGAVTHKVYFDVNEARVTDRNVAPIMDPCATLNEPVAESYTPPGPLEWDTTYFWAVDEVNDGDVCSPGPVWNFTVGPNTTSGPAWRSSGDSLYANWGFDEDWGDGNTVADPCWVIPDMPDFEANCVDSPNSWQANYLGRSGVADNNNGVWQGYGDNSIRLKHTDYASPGQYVVIRAGIIWTGDSPPTVKLERMTNFGNGPPLGSSSPDLVAWWGDFEAAGNIKNDENDKEPVLLFAFELCDGWMFSVYEVEFELVEAADNIHVVIESDGEMYLDSVVVDAQWYTPPWASGPRPPDEPDEEEDPEEFSIFPKISLAECTQLIWYPGVWADKHDVYFSTSWADVNSADADDPCGPESEYTYKGRIDVNVYPDGDCLEIAPDTTYFWRVDEVNDACDPCLWRGTIWSFTTSDFRIIEDFEIYIDTSGPGEPNLLSVWEDWTTLYPATAAEAKLSEAEVTSPGTVNTEYGGTKAMQFVYDTSWGKPLYVQRTWASAQDWTAGGFVALWLWFNGEDYNKNDGISLTLGDTDNDKYTIEYDNPFSDVNDVNDDAWHQWGVALEDFNVGANPVEPNRINYLALEVVGATGTGTIFFDDLRLYVRRCLPDTSRLYGDLAGVGGPDCLVDEWDLDAMFEDWLVGDMNVTSVAPSDANLLVHYAFDPCAAYDDLGNPWDSSGNNYHGIGINEPNVHDGILTLSGANSVEIGGDFNSINPFRGAIKGGGDFTIAMSFRTEENSILFSSCPYDPDVNEANGHPDDTDPSFHAMVVFIMPMGEDEPTLNYDNWYIEDAVAEGTLLDGEWHHVATTYDVDTNDHVVYLDGVPGEVSNFDPNLNVPTTHSIRIGTTRHPLFPYELSGVVDMTGDIDEVRIYGQVLSHGEIVNLLGVPAGQAFYSPVPSNAEIYTDEAAGERIVNFKDYNVLLESWLEDLKWPPAE